MIEEFKYRSPESFFIDRSSFYEYEKDPTLIFDDYYRPYRDSKFLILTDESCAEYFLGCLIDGNVKLWDSADLIEALLELSFVIEEKPGLKESYQKAISYFENNFFSMMNYEEAEYEDEWMLEGLQEYYCVGMYPFLHHVMIKARRAAWIAVVKEVLNVIKFHINWRVAKDGYNCLEIYSGMEGGDFTFEEMFEFNIIYWDSEKTIPASQTIKVNYNSGVKWVVDFPDMPLCDNFHFKKIANKEAARILAFHFSCKTDNTAIYHSPDRSLMSTVSSGGYFGSSFKVSIYNNHEINLECYESGGGFLSNTFTKLLSSRDFNHLMKLITHIVFNVHYPNDDYLQLEGAVVPECCDGTSAEVCLYQDGSCLSSGGSGMRSFGGLHDSAPQLAKLISRIFDIDFY